MKNTLIKVMKAVVEFPAFFKKKKAENHKILIAGSCLDSDNHPSQFPRILPKNA
jgi:hypothetical protein